MIMICWYHLKRRKKNPKAPNLSCSRNRSQETTTWSTTSLVSEDAHKLKHDNKVSPLFLVLHFNPTVELGTGSSLIVQNQISTVSKNFIFSSENSRNSI